MTKYHTKPIVIEAEQFFPDKKPWPEAIMESCGSWFVKTLDGWTRVRPRDWIITGVRGERYPCKPDVFRATYERVRRGTGGGT